MLLSFNIKSPGASFPNFNAWRAVQPRRCRGDPNCWRARECYRRSKSSKLRNGIPSQPRVSDKGRGGEALTQFFLAVCPGSGLDGASKPRCHTGSRGPRPLQEGVPPTLQCVLMKGTTVRPVTQIRILEIIHGGPWRPLLMPNGSSGNPLSSISFQSATSSRSGILREGPWYGFLPR